MFKAEFKCPDIEDSQLTLRLSAPVKEWRSVLTNSDGLPIRNMRAVINEAIKHVVRVHEKTHYATNNSAGEIAD